MHKFRNIPIYAGNTDPQDMAGGWGVLAPKLLFSCIPRTIGSDQGCLTLLPSYCQKPCNWIKYPLAPEAWFVRLAPVMRSHSSRSNEMLCLWSSFCQGESLSLAPQGCASVWTKCSRVESQAVCVLAVGTFALHKQSESVMGYDGLAMWCVYHLCIIQAFWHRDTKNVSVCPWSVMNTIPSPSLSH